MIFVKFSSPPYTRMIQNCISNIHNYLFSVLFALWWHLVYLKHAELKPYNKKKTWLWLTVDGYYPPVYLLLPRSSVPPHIYLKITHLAPAGNRPSVYLPCSHTSTCWCKNSAFEPYEATFLGLKLTLSSSCRQ